MVNRRGFLVAVASALSSNARATDVPKIDEPHFPELPPMPLVDLDAMLQKGGLNFVGGYFGQNPKDPSLKPNHMIALYRKPSQTTVRIGGANKEPPKTTPEAYFLVAGKKSGLSIGERPGYTGQVVGISYLKLRSDLMHEATGVPEPENNTCWRGAHLRYENGEFPGYHSYMVAMDAPDQGDFSRFYRGRVDRIEQDLGTLVKPDSYPPSQGLTTRAVSYRLIAQKDTGAWGLLRLTEFIKPDETTEYTVACPHLSGSFRTIDAREFRLYLGSPFPARNPYASPEVSA